MPPEYPRSLLNYLWRPGRRARASGLKLLSQADTPMILKLALAARWRGIHFCITMSFVSI